MYAKPTSPQSIGQVLDGSFRLTAASFKNTWIYALLAAIASYAATIYLFTRGAGTLEQAMQPQTDPVYWTLYCVGLIGSVFFMAAMYLRTDQIARGDSGGPSAIGAALGRLPLLVVLTILTIIAIMVGMVLLIVPGIILAVSLMAAVPIFMLEDKGPIDSLTTSHRLVWGHWWRTLLILIVGGIIAAVLAFVMSFIAAAVAPFIAGDSTELEIALAAVIGIALMGVVLAPFLVSLVLNIYWDLKLRREGGDLAARVQA